MKGREMGFLVLVVLILSGTYLANTSFSTQRQALLAQAAQYDVYLRAHGGNGL